MIRMMVTTHKMMNAPTLITSSDCATTGMPRSFAAMETIPVAITRAKYAG